MNTDKSVQNQKVFVRLDAVLQLQKRYERSLDGERAATGDMAKAAWKGRREAFEEAIACLQLPIEKEAP